MVRHGGPILPDPRLALLAADAVVATAASWAALQAVDGVTLKQAVDAWAAASGTEKATRCADAEAVRWAEWGLQSYFRLLLGAAFLLLGAAEGLPRTRRSAPREQSRSKDTPAS